MAERRMFTQKIIDSDAFLDMPLSAQALYFHLNMRADDDGFVNNPKKIQRVIGASEDDLKILIAKRFILTFETGVIVIKHWRMHNFVRKDRYNPTTYQEEFKSLTVKENGSYTECGNHLATTWQPLDNQMTTKRQPDDNQMAPQVSIGKVSIGKNSNNRRFTPPTIEEVREYCNERHNNINAEEFIDFYESKGWMIGKNKMKDWKACIRTWEKKHSVHSVPASDYIIDQMNGNLPEAKKASDELIEKVKKLQEGI